MFAKKVEPKRGKYLQEYFQVKNTISRFSYCLGLGASLVKKKKGSFLISYKSREINIQMGQIKNGLGMEREGQIELGI